MSGGRPPGGHKIAAAWAIGVVLAVAACGSAPRGSAAVASSLLVDGAGSTFAAPMYQQWASTYQQAVDHGVQVRYQSIGSGRGIAAFAKGSIQFGATDAPLPAAALQSARRALHSPVLQLPMFLGAVAIIVNVPGVRRLALSGRVLAAIYLGKIVRWNDPAVARLNPGRRLPGTPIKVIERSDSSGTSYVFSRYLTVTSRHWAMEVGASKLPTWPVGTGAAGSSGVAASVQEAKGAIGYVELGYAVTGRIPYASLINAAGRAVAPSPASIGAAATGLPFAQRPPALTFGLINSPAPGAYPLSTPTYLLVARDQRSRVKGRALKAWLEWALQPAQQRAVGSLSYAPLPPALDSLVLTAVRTIR